MGTEYLFIFFIRRFEEQTEPTQCTYSTSTIQRTHSVSSVCMIPVQPVEKSIDLSTHYNLYYNTQYGVGTVYEYIPVYTLRVPPVLILLYRYSSQTAVVRRIAIPYRCCSSRHIQNKLLHERTVRRTLLVRWKHLFRTVFAEQMRTECIYESTVGSTMQSFSTVLSTPYEHTSSTSTGTTTVQVIE